MKTFLSKAEGGKTITSYRKNEKIFSQGDLSDAVFYIQEGKVKVCVTSEIGKEAVVALHRKGDFFGKGCLIAQPLRLATASAMTNCVLMRLDKETMVRVLRDEQQFSEMFIAHMVARTARVEEDLVDQLFNSSEKRLARVLLLMANFGKEGKPEPVIAKISQETLAEIVGNMIRLAKRSDFQAIADALDENQRRMFARHCSRADADGALMRLAVSHPIAATVERDGKPVAIAGAVINDRRAARKETAMQDDGLSPLRAPPARPIFHARQRLPGAMYAGPSGVTAGARSFRDAQQRRARNQANAQTFLIGGGSSVQFASAAAAVRSPADSDGERVNNQ